MSDKRKTTADLADIPDTGDKIADAITHFWGERCADKVEGCAVCDAWAEYDAMKADLFRWRTSAMTGLEEITKLRAENTRLREDLASAREGRDYAD